MTRVAIIGTGISGLGCAWLLHSRCDLTVFEQNDYAGGHTNTVTFQEDGQEKPLDTGFMVFNHVTYPLLTRLFRELGVATKTTDMSFSVQHRPSNLEYNGGSLDLLFGQRRNLFRPRHWRMLAAINRFNLEAVTALEDSSCSQQTVREYVEQRGYGADMLNLYLVPMSSAVWSTPPERMLDFPITTLIRFWHNHGFLGLNTQHQWHTVVDGARSYVKKLTAPFHDRVALREKAVKVRRRDGKVEVTLAGGAVREFDKVILASHADQSLALLEDPTELEGRLLSDFKYQPNKATVHTDRSVMPRTRRCWASWNYRIDAGPERRTLPSTHYWMNSLQGVSNRQDYFVSLNSEDRIDPAKILKRIDYEHPLFSVSAVRAQRELPALNRLGPDQTTYYAGAWHRFGFHEDGLWSALNCARALTGEQLWS